MSRTLLEVGRDPLGGRLRVLVRTDGPQGRGHLGVRVLSSGTDRARVALVAEGALLLAGDEVAIDVRVGDGVRLDVVEPAGTVAFDMRGGSARWGVHVEVGDRAELCWRAEPFVVATGATVDRRLEVVLRGSGCATLREVIVMGRVHEAGGIVRQRFRASADGRPLLVEDLSIDGLRPRAGVLGAHRVLDSVSVLGRRSPEPAPPGAHRLELHDRGTVLRHLGADTHSSPLGPLWAALVAAPLVETVPV